MMLLLKIPQNRRGLKQMIASRYKKYDLEYLRTKEG
ncbi:Uncharacterised protein [Listeria newyorkensis]|nr:Uncharacterised protein [Listeria newyorkensis]